MTAASASAPGVALITGVTGQDGVHLARLLVLRGFRVVGTVRPTLSANAMAPYLRDIETVSLDLTDQSGVSELIERLRPTHIYNLAAFSSVGASWGHAELVGETNGMAVLRLLEELRKFRDRHGWAPRFFQASTSEMFGFTQVQPQNEQTPHHPRSPYAAAKSFAHHLTVNYRESYGLFACAGVLYNHESPLRGAHFVTRKITTAAAAIALGQAESVTLGNLDVRRDWAWAGDYVDAMYRMMTADEPDDFVIASGVSRPLSELLDVAFAAAGLGDPAAYLQQDPHLMRPADVPDLRGDPSKAHGALGWKPSVTFENVIGHMVRVDLSRLSGGPAEHMDYLDPMFDPTALRT